MKSLILSLIFTLCTFAQPFTLIGLMDTGVSYETELESLLARWSTQPSTELKGYYNEFCGCIKDSADAYNNFLALYLALGDSANSLENWIQDDFNLTPAGTGLTFVANEGWLSNTTGYLNTGFTASTEGGTIYTLNDAHVSTYNTGNRAAGEYYEIGAYQSTGFYGVRLKSRDAGDLVVSVFNATNADNESNDDASGLILLSRDNSSDYDIYTRGSFLSTETENSSSLPNLDMFILATNESSVPGAYGFSISRVFLVSIGSALTSTQVRGFNNCINQLRTRLGVTTY